MKKRVCILKITVFLLLMILSGANLLYAQFYKDYSPDKLKKVAEAYYLVGRQYKDTGISRGQAYIDLAYEIYPELDPADIKDEDQELHIEPTTKSFYDKEIKLIEYRFKRLANHFLAKNTQEMTEFFDSVIYNWDFDTYSTNKALREEMDAVLDSIEIGVTTIDALYYTDRIRIKPIEDYVKGELIYELTVEVKYYDLNKYFPFWHTIQKYYWRKDSLDNWIIFSLSGLPEAKYMADQKEFQDIHDAVVNNYKSCLEAFIDEDTKGVINYLHDEVDLLKYKTSVKKSEIEYTFSGYFDETDPPSIGSVNSLLKKVIVRYNDVYTNEYGSKVYVLEVELNEAYVEQLSFWAAYKKYFFIKDNSGWKIRAIE